MNSDKQTLHFFQDGGGLDPASPTYIERRADLELKHYLSEGLFCYVLTTRQMGKTSLMNRVAKQLEAEEKILTAIVDMSLLTGVDSTNVRRWYFGIAEGILDSLEIEFKLKDWWEQGELSEQQLFVRFLRDVLLVKTDKKIVIFFDEIDATIPLKFGGDFFVALRSCYNARPRQPQFQRIAFVLLGVASPGDLIDDKRRTPFNIAKRIDLTDFTKEEAKALLPGLGDDKTVAQETLDAVLSWTGGHPYLTQHFCDSLVRAREVTPARLEQIVEKELQDDAERSGNSNLKFVADRMSAQISERGLRLYRKLLRGESENDRALSPTQIFLKLTGIVKVNTSGKLVVRNKLYRTAFDDTWASDIRPRNYAKLVATMSVAMLCMAAITFWFIQKPNQLAKKLSQFDSELVSAEETYRELRGQPFSRGRADQLWAEFLGRFGRGQIEQDRFNNNNLYAEIMDTYEIWAAIPDGDAAAGSDEFLACFWDDRASRSEAAEKRDVALVQRLKAQEARSTPERTTRVCSLLQQGYPIMERDRALSNLPPRAPAISDHRWISDHSGQHIALISREDKTIRYWRIDESGVINRPKAIEMSSNIEPVMLCLSLIHI